MARIAYLTGVANQSVPIKARATGARHITDTADRTHSGCNGVDVTGLAPQAFCRSCRPPDENYEGLLLKANECAPMDPIYFPAGQAVQDEAAAANYIFKFAF